MARPPVLPTFATNATYPAGGSAWSGQPPRVAPAGGTLAQGFTPQTDLPAEYLNYLIGLCFDWLNYHDKNLGFTAYGDGSDGSYTLDGVQAAVAGLFSKSGNVYTLLRDTAFVNLTVTGAGVVLQTANYRLIGNGACVTASGGQIRNDGASGVSGGVAIAAGSLGTGTNGGAGQNGGATHPGTNATNALGGVGGTGGITVAGGTVTAPNENLGSPRVFSNQTLGWIFSYAGAWTQIQGGSGGGGGPDTGSGGGQGGAGAGVSVIAFPTFTLANASDLTCQGGAGQAGSAGGANASGGGGGGGGYMVVVCTTCNQTLSAAVNCPGGPGGALGGGTGHNGGTGAAGTLRMFVTA